jgi:hypothetical protein
MPSEGRWDTIAEAKGAPSRQAHPHELLQVMAPLPFVAADVARRSQAARAIVAITPRLLSPL